MALTPHPVPGKAKSQMLCDAFISGAPRDAEGHVFYGVTDGNAAVWRDVIRSKAPFWFIDNSYFDVCRGVQFRVTRNAVQHPGTGASQGARFNALGLPPPEGISLDRNGYVLAVEQSPVFMEHIARNAAWLRDTLSQYGGGRRVVLRPWSPNKLTLTESLSAALAGASMVITHSSAAAVEAVLRGVPIVTSPVCAAYSAGLMGPKEHIRQWAGVLADNQFTISELKDGTAWEMLNRN